MKRRADQISHLQLISQFSAQFSLLESQLVTISVCVPAAASWAHCASLCIPLHSASGELMVSPELCSLRPTLLLSAWIDSFLHSFFFFEKERETGTICSEVCHLKLSPVLLKLLLCVTRELL